MFLVSLVFFGIIGAVMGSFGNVLVMRFASDRSILGRSACDACQHTLGAFDLFPIASFILLRGRCRYCSAAFSPRYIMMEIVCAGLFMLAFALYPQTLFQAAVTAIIFFGLLLAAIFDSEHQQIPDVFTGMIFIGGFASAVLSHGLMSGMIGALICVCWFGAQWILSRGSYVGSGDIVLGMSLGLWLGWQLTIAMLCVSYISGMLFALFLLATKRAVFGGHTRIAFGPFLATGGVLSFIAVRDIQLTMLLAMLCVLAHAYTATSMEKVQAVQKS